MKKKKEIINSKLFKQKRNLKYYIKNYFIEYFMSILLVVFYYGYNQNKDIKEVLPNYQTIIDNSTNLYNSLNLDNCNDINSLFNYMIQNGFFSHNNHFTYDDDSIVSNFNCLGLDVMDGTAICANEASLLNDILNKLGYESYICTCNTTNGKISDISLAPYLKINANKTEHDITNNKSSSSKQNSILYNVIGNHMIVIAKKNNYWIGYDPTNGLIFDVNGKRLDIVNGNGFFYFNHIIKNLNGLFIPDFYTTSKINIQSKEDSFNIGEALYDYNNGNELYFNNHDRIVKFRIDIEEDINKINNYILKKTKGN